MLDHYEKILRKLDRPPAGPNWVRFVCDNPLQSAKAIFSFVNGQPPFNYFPGYRAAKDRVELHISEEDAVKSASSKGAPLGRERNKEFVEAFLSHDRERQYTSSNPIGFDTEYFRVSRDVKIPVAPVSIIRECGNFVPLFMCGWETVPLRLRQRRLLMTIYEDAFFSLTDYQKSPAEILFFPKLDGTENRTALIWKRGDYELLSTKMLNECVEIFLLAREIVRKRILEEIEREITAGRAGRGPNGGAGSSPPPPK
jgi:hypothetical protein